MKTPETDRIEEEIDKVRAIVAHLNEVDQGLLYVVDNPKRELDSTVRADLDSAKDQLFRANAALVSYWLDFRPVLFPRLDSDLLHGIWLIVQHSDHDPAFQKRVLEMFLSMPQGQVPIRDIAYLSDRVAVNEGRPQRYGTQVQYDENEDALPFTLEDPEQVDEWRDSVGLEPLASYLSFMSARRKPAGTPVKIIISR